MLGVYIYKYEISGFVKGNLCFIVDRELRVLLNIKQLTRKCYCKRRDFRNFSRPLSCIAPANIFDIFFTSLASGAFLVAPLRTCCNFPAFDPFAFLLLARYWHFVLLLQLGSVTHSPLFALSHIMDSL